MSGKCLDELLVSMFLDNELTPGERKRVETHLETCTLCQELIRQREAENTQLKEIFKTTHTPDLVPAVIEKLRTSGFSSGYQWGQRHQRSMFINLLNYRWVLVTAASILLVGFLLIFLLLINPAKSDSSEKQVILCSAQVDGQEVQTHIYESTEPDIQFIWLEKKNEHKEGIK